MVNWIVPPDQTDADRIADFVNGYLGGNRAANKRMETNVLHVAEAVLAYKAYRMYRKAARRRGR